ncbi:MAG: MBL fold metallo-hydrolase, partial [Alphaproteobacteria bacterium]|nr:MBL fold metallo-hydrolase [Alphaproteobacteria bacterium]
MSLAVQAQDYDKVEIKTQPLRGGLYALFGTGGNIGLSVGEDGIVLIDDQYAPLTGKIRAAIAEISDKPIQYVINTHFHGDH